MDQNVKSKWVAALRSGEYKQGRGQLRNEKNEFCCWGVLCDLHGEEWRGNMYLGSQLIPPKSVYAWAGLPAHVSVRIGDVYKTLSRHNDGGRTLAEIADAIEEQL